MRERNRTRSFFYSATWFLRLKDGERNAGSCVHHLMSKLMHFLLFCSYKIRNTLCSEVIRQVLRHTLLPYSTLFPSDKRATTFSSKAVPISPPDTTVKIYPEQYLYFFWLWTPESLYHGQLSDGFLQHDTVFLMKTWEKVPWSARCAFPLALLLLWYCSGPPLTPWPLLLPGLTLFPGVLRQQTHTQKKEKSVTDCSLNRNCQYWWS